MRHTIKTLMIGATLLLGAAACANLDVVNKNNPDAVRTLATPHDLESLISGGFNTWFEGFYSWDGGPGAFLSNAAFQHTAPWANAAMEFYARIPRQPFINDAADSNYGNISGVWYAEYSAIAAVSSGLKSLQDPNIADVLNADDPGSVTRDQAFGYYVLGLAHATLALMYDQAFIIDETTDITQPQTASSYKDVMSAALGYFDKSIALCNANTFSIPAGWMSSPNGDISSAMLVKIEKAQEAIDMAAVARTPTERKAADWTKISSLADAGMTMGADWSMTMDANNWYNGPLDAEQSDGWTEIPYFVYGMADQSGNYKTWLDQSIANKTPNPSSGALLIMTPDLRFPQGDSLAAQRDSAGTYIEAPASIGGVWAHPERGTWRWSWYRVYRYMQYTADYNNTIPEIQLSALNLLKAEADYYAGDYADVATIINTTRVPAGLNAIPTTTDASNADNTSCVPKVPAGDGTSTLKCGNLWEMLKWEKRMEGMFIGLGGAPWWYDSRGWGDLFVDTPLEFPVPCKELQTLQILPCYTFGGSGGTMAAPISSYNYPGEASYK
jgi:starch-binding outer membrane protein, SusD/RagB family